MGNFRPE